MKTGMTSNHLPRACPTAEIRWRRTRVRIELPTRAQGLRAVKFGAVAVVTALSAIVTKEMQAGNGRGELSPLVALEHRGEQGGGNWFGARSAAAAVITERAAAPVGAAPEVKPEMKPDAKVEIVADEPAAIEAGAEVRYFNGRPVRPARTITMVVTAYSPDAISCEGSDDGITASIHHVETNGGALVAADTRVLPLGSMLTIPGYADGDIVPVLDRGGAIKGKRLDVLYPTHRQARKWGKQTLEVTVWEYADGLPKDDYRKLRGGRRRW